MKRAIPSPEKKNRMAFHRISRTTETGLSVLCLAWFVLSTSVLLGMPIYLLRDWLLSLEQYEWTLFFSAYLLALPVALLTARYSLRLLVQVEAMGGRRVSFKRRLKRLKQREKGYPYKPVVYRTYPKIFVQKREEITRPIAAKVVRPIY